MELKKAYQMVFKDLCGSCRLFEGIYDATHKQVQYMVGIETVMEVIANRGYGDDFADEFAYKFDNNMERSKRNV